MSSNPEILPPLATPPQPEPAVPTRPLALRPPLKLGLLDILPDDPLYDTAQLTGEYILASKAAATRRAYDSDWRDFEAYCQRHSLASLPAEPRTVALYITHLSNPKNGEKPRKAATITRRLTAINAVHKAADLDSPATMNHRVLALTFHGLQAHHRHRAEHEEAAHP